MNYRDARTWYALGAAALLLVVVVLVVLLPQEPGPGHMASDPPAAPPTVRDAREEKADWAGWDDDFEGEPEDLSWFTEVFPGRGPRAPRGPRDDEVVCAAVQFASRLGEVERNRKALLVMAGKAAGRGAKLIVLPETAVQGYASQDHGTVWARPDFPSITTEKSLEGHAETVPGESTRAFGEVARKHECYISVPIAEHEPKTGKYFNTVVVMGPDGEIACHYRKLVPWTVMEYAWSSEGDRGLGIVETPYGRVGVMICFDIHSVLAKLSGRKVDIVMYSVAWVDPNPSLWFGESLPLRARDNDAALVLANWSCDASRRRNPGFGFSRIVSREGKLLGSATREYGNQIVYGLLPKGKAGR